MLRENFTHKYLIAAFVTIILIVFNQVIIQHALSKKKYDAKIINISGKQRMLSQKAVSQLQNFYLYKNTASKLALQNTFDEWQSVHIGLMNGDPKLKIKKVAPDLIQKLQALSPNIDFLESTIANISNITIEDLEKVNISQASFLTEMNNIVNELEKNSNDKLYNIRLIEILLACLTLLVIGLEILFVFKPTNKKLIDQNKSLKNKNQVLEDYAFIASHDLRTPIQNISNFTNLLTKTTEYKLDENEKAYLNFISENSKKMDDTTKNLLAFSISDQIDIKQINVNENLKSVLNSLNDEIAAKKANINIDELPELINADPNLLDLVFSNLISNALKFIYPNKKPEIRISVETQKDRFVFSIKDNGIGIPKSEQEGIFKLFSRQSTNNEFNSKSGIGLPLSQRIVNGHYGDMWLESEVDKGSTFYFSIPKN